MYLCTEVLSDDDDDGTDMAMAVEIRGLVGIVALLLYCTSSSLGFAWRRRLSETVDRAGTTKVYPQPRFLYRKRDILCSGCPVPRCLFWVIAECRVNFFTIIFRHILLLFLSFLLPCPSRSEPWRVAWRNPLPFLPLIVWPAQPVSDVNGCLD